MRTRAPFRLVGGDQPLIVVSASFNGSESIDCALDTGASHVMLLPEIGSRLGVKVEQTRQGMGAGGPIQVQLGTAASVAVGDALARDVSVLMSDELRRIGQAIGLSLGGNIGYSFLERFRLGLDYERQELSLATAEEPADTTAARAELGFTLAHPSKPLIMIPVLANGERHAFAVDTGASTTVISPELARRHHVDGVAAPNMTGGGGTVTAAAGVLESLEIGTVRLSRVRVMVADFLEGLGKALGAPLDGIVGTNVLRRFRVTIDYPRKILRLE